MMLAPALLWANEPTYPLVKQGEQFATAVNYTSNGKLYVGEYYEEGLGILTYDKGGALIARTDIISIVNAGDHYIFLQIEVDESTGEIVAMGDFRGQLNVGGTIYNSTTGSEGDQFIIRYDAEGNIVKFKNFPIQGGAANRQIAVGSDGNIIFSFGIFQTISVDGVTIDPANGDYFIGKFDEANFNLMTYQQYAGWRRVYQSPLGKLYLTGHDGNIGADLDPATLTEGTNLGLLPNEVQTDDIQIARGPDGNFLVVANYYTTSNAVQIFIGKWNPSSNAWVYQKSVGGIGDDGGGLRMATDQQGNIFLAANFRNAWSWDGVTMSSKGDNDIFLAKISNATGNLLWIKQFGAQDHDSIYAFDVAPNGSHIRMYGWISGQAEVDGAMISPNNNYMLEWAQNPMPALTPSSHRGYGEGIDFRNDTWAGSTFSNGMTFEMLYNPQFVPQSTGYWMVLADGDFFKLQYHLADDGREVMEVYLGDGMDNGFSNKDLFYAFDMREHGGFQTDRWYHFAFTYHKKMLTIYMDGVVVLSVPAAQWSGIPSSSFFAVPNEEAYVDEIRLWDDIRTSKEIRDNVTTTLDLPQTGLVGYWPMNASTHFGGDDYATPDESGFGYDLNYNGTTSEIVAVKPPVLNVPTNVTENGFEVSWDEVVGAQKIWLQVSDQMDFSTIVFDESNAFTPYQVNNLKPGTTYYVRATAFDGDGFTAWSATQEVTTEGLLIDGLVAHYPFREDFTDRSGNDYDATSLGGAYILESELFIGDNAQDAVAIPAEVVNGNGNFTLSAWVRFDTFAFSGNTVFSAFSASVADVLNIEYNEGGDAWVVSINDQPYWFYGNTVEDLAYHHITVTRDGTTLSFYLDGSLLDSDTGADNTVLGVSSAVVGQDLVTATAYYSNKALGGNVGQLRIFDRALLSDEVSMVYNYDLQPGAVPIVLEDLIDVSQTEQLNENTNNIVNDVYAIQFAQGENIQRVELNVISTDDYFTGDLPSTYTMSPLGGGRFEVTTFGSSNFGVYYDFIIELTNGQVLTFPEEDYYLRYQTYDQGLYNFVDFMGIGLDQDDYSIFSIPFAEQDKRMRVSDLFPNLGETDKSRWRIVEWSGNTYRDLSASSVIQPGKAYWALMSDYTDLPSPYMTTETATGVGKWDEQGMKPFTLTLKPGWNMVSIPFNYEINWGRIIDLNADWAFEDGNEALGVTLINDISYDLLTWNYGVDNRSVMSPFEGYFVENRSFSDVQIDIYPVAMLYSEEGFVRTAASQQWKLSMSVKQGELWHETAFLGMHEKASKSLDGRDLKMAPMLLDNLPKVTFERAELEGEAVIGDIVPLSDKEEWKVRFASVDGNGMTLKWNKPELPLGKQLLLLDEQQQKVIDMGVQQQYQQVTASATYTVLYGNSEELADQLLAKGMLPVNVYPNPAVSSTQLEVILPLQTAQTDLSVSIMDITGRKVKQLYQGTTLGGRSTFTWDVIGDDGARVKSGVYIYQITIDGKAPVNGKIIVAN
ncbi:hypothetical protein GCM10023331_11360 [Algivirga pacifica]|uniref:Fibronectin type-III domain-containing protein n=2 Tax=Algivirga pacifica TaxID=1162670 RepID=A0ABP9D426_9BACT